MNVTLSLSRELEAASWTQAQASGMTVEEYLHSVVESAVLPRDQQNFFAEERAATFEAWSLSHRPTPLLSDFAIGRERFYDGNDS